MTTPDRTEDPDDVPPDRLLKWALNVFIGILVLIGAVFLFYMLHFGKDTVPKELARWGEFGDFMGGTLNPLIGVATIFLLFIGLLVQRRELKETSRALHLANRHAGIQAFEQSLFSWLSTYRSLLDSMESPSRGQTFVARGRRLLSFWYDRDLAPSWEGNFKVLNANDGPNLLGKAREKYRALFRTHRTELDAYLQTLFRIFAWIDKHPELDGPQKWHYASLVRAQLSWVELAFLFYNGLTDEGKKFVQICEDYALFDNIRTGKDQLIEGVADRAINHIRDAESGKSEEIPYTRRSFSSDAARQPKAMRFAQQAKQGAMGSTSETTNPPLGAG